MELGIREYVEYGWNTGGIRQNTGLWEVIWNTWKTYSDSRHSRHIYTTFDKNMFGDTVCLEVTAPTLNSSPFKPIYGQVGRNTLLLLSTRTAQ